MAKKGTAGTTNTTKTTKQPTAAAPAPGRPSALLDTRIIYCGDTGEAGRTCSA